MHSGVGIEHDYCTRSAIPSNYSTLLKLLKFYRKSGRLYMLDMLANAANPAAFDAVLSEMKSLYDRLEPIVIDKLKCCICEECEGAECEWYRSLGANVDEKRKECKVCVPCEKIDEHKWNEELQRFLDCVEKGRLLPYDLIVYAY